uniref:Arf-GAP domain-containing protein n=1 Tax=Pyrodinium bahamense TaxID=73915 RepID=A0A7S0B743_9DINO
MEALDAQTFAQVDEKGFVPDEVRNTFFRKLRMKTDNRTCFECPARNPTWNSLTYGVYLCLECSGEHRRKGVHLSFVRSVELDRFSPDQMVQMALGGNAKAWNYFKTHGMGKTSDGGRAIDYNSKIAQRYKQELEKSTKETCAKMSIACKATTQAPPAKADPIDEATDFAFALPSTPTNLQSFKSAPAVVQSTPAVAPPSMQPKPVAAAPASVVIRRVAAEPAPTQSATPGSGVAAAAAAAPLAKPTGFASSKQMAKQIEFDFDFDELEAEASKPAPAPAPKPAAAPALSSSASAPAATPAPSQAYSASAVEKNSSNRFGKSKAISSEDFFGDLAMESASQRVEREERYNKFSSASAISSSSFFGDGDPDDPLRRGEPDNWKAAASDYAKVGLSKGAELLTTYLNKVRD